MGCPCSQRNHPRQQGAEDGDKSATEPETRRPAVDRGFYWHGPKGRKKTAAADTPTAE